MLTFTATAATFPFPLPILLLGVAEFRQLSSLHCGLAWGAGPARRFPPYLHLHCGLAWGAGPARRFPPYLHLHCGLAWGAGPAPVPTIPTSALRACLGSRAGASSHHTYICTAAGLGSRAGASSHHTYICTAGLPGEQGRRRFLPYLHLDYSFTIRRYYSYEGHRSGGVKFFLLK